MKIVVKTVEKDADGELDRIERRIAEIKRLLQEVGDARPGSLTRQYRLPKEKVGPYYQVSYTHKMRSRTEYVRPEHVRRIKREIVAYKRFRKLTTEWTDLAIRQSSLRLKLPARGGGK
jgi:hypothetical protein